VSNEHSNGCYQCGSPGGSMTTLCPRCIADSEAKRSKLRKELYVDRTGERDPFVFRLMTMPVAFGFSAILASSLCIIFILMFADSYNIAGIPLLLGITAACSFLLMVGAWVAVWCTARRHYERSSMIPLVCPPMLYSPIIQAMRSDGADRLWADVHIAFTAHIVGIIIFVGTVGMAVALDVNLFNGRTYVKSAQ
jgi:hypothetical protein